MCGIGGFYDLDNSLALDERSSLAEKMADAIYHRGPDDGGVWVDRETPLAFFHRRLSIVDLTPAGHQPMISNSGRYVIVFNGEIYNHAEIKKSLFSRSDGFSGHSWRGNSDTEVLLAAIETWGLVEALRRATGMFALGLWDKKHRVLSLARDRIGEKPLYYGWQGRSFIFGSELKSFRKHPQFEGRLNTTSIISQFQHSYIPAPNSIYLGVFKLVPGSIFFITLENGARSGPSEGQLFRYWDFNKVVNEGKSSPSTISIPDSVDHLDTLIRTSVSRQILADVPVGAFLSGGIDSTTIVSIMQSLSSIPVNTFTIGFEDADYNEAEYAKDVAKRLGTAHTELYITSADAIDVIPTLPQLYDEPFSDSSQIPTYLVSKLARQNVTVSLSGDGGDELFGGYSRYQVIARYIKFIEAIPYFARSSLGSALSSVHGVSKGRFSRFASSLLHSTRWRNYPFHLERIGEVLAARNRSDIYSRLFCHWRQSENLVINSRVDSSDHFGFDIHDMDPIESMMYMDTLSYLPEDILAKVDRAAMGVSLETRVPFLDHDIVEFAWKLPLSHKVREGKSKWILRKVLDRYVDSSLFDRPKMGFGVPIGTWLRGPLRPWAESLLDSSRIVGDGILNPAPILNKWRQHISGSHNWQYQLWDVLMFQAWLDSVRRR